MSARPKAKQNATSKPTRPTPPVGPRITVQLSRIDLDLELADVIAEALTKGNTHYDALIEELTCHVVDRFLTHLTTLGMHVLIDDGAGLHEFGEKEDCA